MASNSNSPNLTVVTGFGPYRNYFVNSSWEAVKLSVHVGMMSSSKAIALEQCGRNKGYMEKDLSDAHPQGGCCLLEGPERIESAVNMKSVCKNISWPGVHVIHSRDAGRYLCEYAYYITMYYGAGKAVFIHVPPLSRIITAELLGHALQIIIQEVLRQLNQLCA